MTSFCEEEKEKGKERMIKKALSGMFPKEFYPTRMSVVFHVVLTLSGLWLLFTLAMFPILGSHLGYNFTQPRELNGVFLAAFVAGLAGYAIERGKHGESN